MIKSPPQSSLQATQAQLSHNKITPILSNNPPLDPLLIPCLSCTKEPQNGHSTPDLASPGLSSSRITSFILLAKLFLMHPRIPLATRAHFWLRDSLLFTQTPSSFSTKLLPKTDYPAAILWQDELFFLFPRWPWSCFTLENFISSHTVFCATYLCLQLYGVILTLLCFTSFPCSVEQPCLFCFFVPFERLWRVKRGKQYGYPGHHRNEKRLKERVAMDRNEGVQFSQDLIPLLSCYLLVLPVISLQPYRSSSLISYPYRIPPPS